MKADLPRTEAKLLVLGPPAGLKCDCKLKLPIIFS